MKNERWDAPVDSEVESSDLPEPLDTELPPPPAIVGIRGRRVLWMIGSLALLLRILLLPLGHAWDLTVDYNVFIDLAKNQSPYDAFATLTHIARSAGLARFNGYYEYYAYPPIPIYLYYLPAKIYLLFHPHANYFISVPKSSAIPNLTLDFFFLFKAPIWVADFLIAALLARMSCTIRGFRDYLLNPYVLLVSGAWTFDAIMVFGLVAGVYAIHKNKMIWAGIALAFGTMVKFFPVIAVPTVLIYLIKKNRPFKEIVLFLVSYGIACLIFLGPFLQGVLEVLNFQSTRTGTGMSWQFLLTADSLFPGNILSPINHALAVFGTSILAIVMLLTYWYIWRTRMTLNRMIIVTLLGFYIGTKVLNEQYALMIVPFAWLEAYRLRGSWRWIYRLLWIIPLAFAFMHVPFDRFFLLFYHMILGNKAAITSRGITGFEWSLFPWKNPFSQQLITASLGICFFGLSLAALFRPVRWPAQSQRSPNNRKIPETPQAMKLVLDTIAKVLTGQEFTAFSFIKGAASYHEPAGIAESPGIEDHIPPPISPASRTDVIPTFPLAVPLTPLFGREQDLAQLTALLRQPEIRLLTLTGPGGAGKTRLLLAIAHGLPPDFAEHIHFVSLATLNDPTFVLPAIAQALGLREEGTRLLLEELQKAIGFQSLLLLLDSFERVRAAAPELFDLLDTCPHLRLLVTSRAALRIAGEQEFPVSPLPLPDLRSQLSPGALSQYAALILFTQCAQTIQPDFQMTEANSRFIAEICLCLEGLPLAIELAAVRTRLLSPQMLLVSLERHLAALTGEPHSRPASQQTLRATIAWSYDLLDPLEQQLFYSLSVFAGGCTLQAVEAFAKALDLSETEILDGVSDLLENRLLCLEEQSDGELRLLMVETIREYGRECLHASKDLPAVQRAHTRYYLALAQEAEPHFSGPEQARWLDRLDRELENLRAVLQHTMAGEDEEREDALRLGKALARFWYERGHARDGRNWLEWVQTQPREDTIVFVQALSQAARIAIWQGEYELAQILRSESLAIYQELSDVQGMMSAL